MKKLTLLLLSVILVSCLVPPPPMAPRPPFPSQRPAPSRPQPEPRSHPPAPSNKSKSLIGLSEAEATYQAGLMGLSYRVVKRDGVSYPVTMDYSESRLNFTISRGRVIAVTRG